MFDSHSVSVRLKADFSGESLTFLLYVQVSLHGEAAGGFEVIFSGANPLHQPLHLSTGAFKVVTRL